jgi:hypothetical protein
MTQRKKGGGDTKKGFRKEDISPKRVFLTRKVFFCVDLSVTVQTSGDSCENRG